MRAYFCLDKWFNIISNPLNVDEFYCRYVVYNVSLEIGTNKSLVSHSLR